MNSTIRIGRILNDIGDKDNGKLVALSNVWVHYGTTDLNIYYKGLDIYVMFPCGYEYKLSTLYAEEVFSIWYSLNQYYIEYKNMLNEKDKFEMEF